MKFGKCKCDKIIGKVVRDKVTGFQGVVTGRTTWLNGCSRVIVHSQDLHDGKPIDAQWFDEPQVEIVDVKGVKRGSRDTGGPKPDPRGPRD
jgi:hypothetical protein